MATARYADIQQMRANLVIAGMRALYPPPQKDVAGDHLAWLEGWMHPGQRRAWESDKRFIAVLAGTQGGKTSWAPWWLWREIQRRGPGDYLAVTATYDMFKLAMLPALIELFVNKLGIGEYRPSDRIIDLPTLGARIILRSAESGGGLESSTAKAAWLDEAGQDNYTIGTWEAVLRRLSINQGRALLTTTLYNLGWLKQAIYDRWIAGDESIDVIQFDSTENPAFPKEEFDRARDSMPLWKFNMFYRGMFERPAGLIYDRFDTSDKEIVRPRIPIPDNWPRYLGLDFGGVHTAGLFFAEELGTTRWWAYREYLAGHRTAKEHVTALLHSEPMIPFAVGGSHSEDQWRHEFRVGGLSVNEPDIKDVFLGIERVYGGDKRRETIVFDDLRGYLDQKARYSYKLDERGEVREPKEIEEKATFHLCFVAGTMITTDRGDVPIEQVRVGMRALTRQGYQIIRATMNRRADNLQRLQFSDGRTLIGTADHPIWVRGRGFTRLDCVRYSDIIETDDLYRKEYQTCPEKLFNTTGSTITATLKPKAYQIGATSNTQANYFTERYGRHSMVLFLKAALFITRTMMAATMLSKTLKRYPAEGTKVITQTYGQRANYALSQRLVARLLRHGTRHQPDVRGILNIALAQWQIVSLLSENAINVANPIAQSAGAKVRGFAPINARPHLDSRAALMTLSKPVLSADKSLPLTSTPDPNAVPVFALKTSDAANNTVYNITVEDQHEYFANGVLVSNCDCERYIQGWRYRARKTASAVVGKPRPPIQQAGYR